MNTARANRIARNFAILSVAEIIGRGLAFGVTIYLTRVLEADGYGLIVFATGVLVYASMVVDFGFHNFGPILVAREEYPLKELTQTVVAVRTLTTLVAFLALSAFILMVNVPILAKSITLLYGISLIMDALDLRWIYLGREDMRLLAFAEILEQVVLFSGVIILIKQPESVLLMPVVYLGARLSSVSVLQIDFIRKFGWPRLKINKDYFKSVYRETLSFAGATLIGNLLSNFDIILIGIWLSVEATGLYGAAYRVVWVPVLLVSAFYVAQRPALARGYVNGFETVLPILRRSLRLIAILSIGLLVGGVIVAKPLVVFLFGDDFQGAAAPLQLLLTATAILLVNRQYRAILSNFNQQTRMLQMMAIGAAINVSLNLILIVPFGLRGAAMATVVSEAALLVIGYTMTDRLVGHIPFWTYLTKPALSAAIMAVVLLVSQSMHIVLRVVLGGGVYLAILYLWRGISTYDIQLLLGPLLPGQSKFLKAE